VPLNTSSAELYRMIANEAKTSAEFPEFYAPTRESGDKPTVYSFAPALTRDQNPRLGSPSAGAFDNRLIFNDKTNAYVIIENITLYAGEHFHFVFWS
jgi:hypothetical protein